MANFFSNKKKETLKPFNVERNVSAEVDTIDVDKQIHEEVYSAQELILNAANTALKEINKYDEESYNRLLKLYELGFTGMKETNAIKSIDCEKTQNNELIKQIAYYNFNYPLNKFISEGIVGNICNKYNLLLSEINRYTAEIPVKNQVEIIDFKIRRKDVRVPYEVLRNMQWMPAWGVTQNNGQISNEPVVAPDENELLSGQHLLIIAPVEKLNTSNSVIEGHVLKSKDPIVLQPVVGGFLIISGWGVEAGDEQVVNQINN